MLKAFFEFGERISLEAKLSVVATIAIVMFTGFFVEMLIQARKAERERHGGR